MKDSLGWDKKRPSPHGKNSLLWFESYPLDDPSVTRKGLIGSIVLRYVAPRKAAW